MSLKQKTFLGNSGTQSERVEGGRTFEFNLRGGGEGFVKRGPFSSYLLISLESEGRMRKAHKLIKAHIV